jgi:phenylacetate-CoA ligase
MRITVDVNDPVNLHLRFFHADEETLEPVVLHALQRRRLAALLGAVRETNPFYRRKLDGIGFDAAGDPMSALPFTTRAELEADQIARPPFGSNLTFPLSSYRRFHQTSGSGGRPMRWLDTAESWDWFKKLWGIIFRAAHVTPGERLMFPFSFGPFVGFWAAFEGAVALGNLCLPAGGLSTGLRLKMLVENDVDVVCCTPTYALHMAETARETGVNLPKAKVRALIVAGEAGGSVPEVRLRIEEGWGARVFDHSGMTEIGALGFECWERPGEGVHLIESECIAEVIDPATGREVPEGRAGELVLTNLGRVGSPLIRYRTGDHVRLTRGRQCACGRWFARLEGGILGRIDDMFTVRGNNVFPAAIEAVIRRFPEVAEFRVTVTSGGALAHVAVEIEPAAGAQVAAGTLATRVAAALQESLSFRADVTAVGAGTLPRFEMKARRFVRKSV